MPSLYRARIAACLRAHTAPLGTHIIIPDEPALLDALAELVSELVREVVADVYRERADAD